MRVIGILGGMSWQSTALYYDAINQGVKSRLGGLHSAELVLYSVDFGAIEKCQHQAIGMVQRLLWPRLASVSRGRGRSDFNCHKHHA